MSPLSDAEKWKLLAKFDLNQAASSLGAESRAKAEAMAEALGVSYMAEVVSQLGTDAAADLLQNLPEDFKNKVLSQIRTEHSTNLKEILAFPPGTAGSLMSKEYLSVSDTATIGEVAEYLRSVASSKKGKVSYIYVVDANCRLEGVIQIRDLIFHEPQKTVRSILKFPVVQVEVGMSQNDVATLLKRHRYLGLPVVDAAQKLVGVISADNVLQAMEEEAADDIAKIVGTSAEEIRTHSVLTVLKLRLPWLLVSLGTGMLCAYLLGMFEKHLEAVAVLFLFVPVILGISESTGVQGATIVVQNIALGNVSFKDMGRLFFREVAAGVLIGLICGAVVGQFASLWQTSSRLGIALSVSMVVTVFISGIIGFLLPLLFRKFKVDPAMASGPLVLAVCDIQTLVLYFTISGYILS